MGNIAFMEDSGFLSRVGDGHSGGRMMMGWGVFSLGGAKQGMDCGRKKSLRGAVMPCSKVGQVPWGEATWGFTYCTSLHTEQ